jgi:hypothetical protein
VKLLILRPDRKLNLQQSTCIYKVSTKCHRNSYFMKNYKCYFFHSFIHSFFHHIHHDVWLWLTTFRVKVSKLAL